jgi:hypothetical protein
VRLVGSYLDITLTNCSTYIYLGAETRATLSDLLIYVGSVPTEHLDTFDTKLHESFCRIITDGVDLNRMKMVIDRDERQVFFRSIVVSTFSDKFQLRSKVEADGGDTFTPTMIANFLYGPLDGSQIEEALDEIKLYNTLRTWSSKQWGDLIEKCADSAQNIRLHDSKYFAGTLLLPNGLSFVESLLQQLQSALRKKKRLASRNKRRF